MDIRELVAQRSDLSTFLVHLTRDSESGVVAGAALKSIISSGLLEARSVYGHARNRLQKGGWETMSQRCVCFTETPLEYTHLLLADIDNRDVHFKPYGIAITKRVGRGLGVNPVWYLDITPGHPWIAANLDRLLDRTLSEGRFTDPDVERLAPFIEHMGTRLDEEGRQIYRKEFWWECEWRFCGGHFALPQRFIGLCPEEHIAGFERLAADVGRPARFIDPRWGLERIIAQLAGFQADEVEIL